jgi:recombination DNA repair RAD52 pathway protein
VSEKAVTDGIKRCLRAFGNALGNCLYDKTFLKKISRVSAPNTSSKPLDPAQLYRSEDGAAHSAQPVKPAPTYNNNTVPQPMPVIAAPKYQNHPQNYTKPGPLPAATAIIQQPIVQSESVSSLDTYAFDEDDSMLMVADLECIDSTLLQSENFTNL